MSRGIRLTRLILSAAILMPLSTALGGSFDLELESGGVWFTKNDARVPGDTGTKFDMLDLTGEGPDPYVRLYARYDFNEKHSLRLNLALLQVDGTGMLSEDVLFEGETFVSGQPVKGTYKFNTYRLTYRWMFYRGSHWDWGFGGALLVRDAKIELEQAGLKETKDDLGLVPLLHLYGAYSLNDHNAIILDVERAAAPQGRAFDVAFKYQYNWSNGWHASAGYRTLEGGADNDSVYTFSWLHYGLVSVGYTF